MALGPLMFDLGGLELEREEIELLEHPLAGGVILFARNYASVEQLTELVGRVHALREPRLLVAVDQEGGRVQRLRDPFTALPAPARLGELHDREPGRARALARTFGWLMAAELRAAGIDFSFAPVLDLGARDRGVIGDRAFHRDPKVVAELGVAFMRGAQEAGVATVGKHFPGHGSVQGDSHTELPVDRRSFATIAARDLVAFERPIRSGLPAVMPAHVVYPEVDARPASLSRVWLGAMLRERLGFGGAIVSDDLGMAGAAVAGGVAERARAALAAGNDLVLVCNERAAVVELCDRLEHAPDPVSAARLARLHGRGGSEWSALVSSTAYREARAALGGLDPAPELDLDADP